MNLLEVLTMYQEFLHIEGRQAADKFLVDIGVEFPHWHIQNCFDDEGYSLSAHAAFETEDGTDGRRTYQFE